MFGEPGEVGIDRSEETDWGLIDRDRHGRAVAIEIWRASAQLPRPVLDALSEPRTPAAESGSGAKSA